MKRRALALVAAMAAAAPSLAHAHGRGCNTNSCDHRIAHDHAKRIKRAAIRPYKAWLLRVSMCESGGRWNINTGNGFYGGLQFTLRSWAAVGGRVTYVKGQLVAGPHTASALDQMYRAVLLLRLQGPGAWPVCGR